MKKLARVLLTALACLSIASCGINPDIGGTTTPDTPGTGECENGSCTTTEIDLDAVNKYFNENVAWENMTQQNGNKVTLIPFTHINGPRAEWDFFAIVNYEYSSSLSVKYQVTFLSCTCRTANVNYWSTAFVTLSKPSSGNIDDVQVKKISFETDDTGLYLAGFWGDSGIKELEPEGINNTGIFYEDIRDQFIPYLVGQKYSYLKTLNVVEDIDNTLFTTKMNGKLFHDDHQVEIDDFSGASVSTNNIIRVLNALIKYHGENNI